MTDTFVNPKHVIGLRNWSKWTTWKGAGYCCVRVAVVLLSFIIGFLSLMAASAAHTHMLFYLFPADKWPLAADFFRPELEVHLQSPPSICRVWTTCWIPTAQQHQCTEYLVFS